MTAAGLKRTLLIVGDSLAMPRGDIAYRDTWPSLLRASCPDLEVIPLSRRGMTTDLIVTEGADSDGFPPGSDFLEFYRPDFSVIQLGIVDCYPRHFRNRGLEQRLVSLLPVMIRNRYIALIKKTRGSKTKFAYVPRARFRGNIESYVERALTNGVMAVVLIAITLVSKRKSEESKDVENIIQAYNAELRTIAEARPKVHYLDPFEGRKGEEWLHPDGYHLSTLGQSLVHASVLDLLTNFRESNSTSRTAGL